MSYIGQPPVLSNFPVDAFVATAGQTAFTLSRNAAGQNSILVSINGAIQQPGTSYSVSGTTLTLAQGAAAGDAVWVWHLGVQGIIQEPADGTVTFAKIANLIQLGTVQATTSGTEFDFPVPTGVRRASVLLDGVSLSGTDHFLVQLGDSGGIENTGYSGRSVRVSSSVTFVVSTAGFAIHGNSPAENFTGILTLELMDEATNTWVSSHMLGRNDGVGSAGGGSKALSAELTTIRVTRSGTNTFDAGSVNITYEK